MNDKLTNRDLTISDFYDDTLRMMSEKKKSLISNGKMKATKINLKNWLETKERGEITL